MSKSFTGTMVILTILAAVGGGRALAAVLLAQGSAAPEAQTSASQPSSQPAAQSSPKPSEYAPVDGLVNQFQEVMERLGEDLSSSDKYAEEQQNRQAMDANTLAAYALVLGMHDQDNPYKAKAGKLIVAAGELAEQAGEYEPSREAYTKLKELVASSEVPASPVSWEPVADIGQLMKQVPIVNNSMRRGVTSRRFERTQERTAAYAAALAALAQASYFDDTYCGDDEDLKLWQQLCGQMRDDAGAVNKAVLKGDQEAAKVAMERIALSCDKCHEQFR